MLRKDLKMMSNTIFKPQISYCWVKNLDNSFRTTVDNRMRGYASCFGDGRCTSQQVAMLKSQWIVPYISLWTAAYIKRFH
jgi:hypothetical protein